MNTRFVVAALAASMIAATSAMAFAPSGGTGGGSAGPAVRVLREWTALLRSGGGLGTPWNARVPRTRATRTPELRRILECGTPGVP